ncbi:YihY/virulence factor BrkB family protein [Halarcobacter bivalviorum]|uniref:YihY/virulence factor BrkB family protein n=1 Tax=Halarcobacter bivalviorum TaxID=663364 RepID=UPI00100A5345|nr:YihY/virulence factor BrkB family protein [Halarcobacter bivalviorum]RXK07125.1 trehalose-6-phosphate synthase [Halarcobacter bivalviorum]
MEEPEIVKNPIKTFLKALDSFFNDDTTYYAASLSFFTIFSILPIIALLIAIISNLEVVQNYADVFIKYTFDILNPTHSEDFIKTFKNYISNSNKLGWLGILYMLFVFIMFFKDYEYIVNKIHNAKRKPLLTSFFFYLFFLITLPLMLAILNIVLSFYDNSIFNWLITFSFAWLIFFGLFKLSVNRHIDTKAAAISSLFTLVVLSVTKNLFVYYVVYNKTYATIYGSLAILLFSFFWIYISWIIYLYGIKMCHKLNVQQLAKRRKA